MLNLTRLLQVPRVDTTFDISLHTDCLAFAWNKTAICNIGILKTWVIQRKITRDDITLHPVFSGPNQRACALICGGNDPRCPARHSMEARDKLEELGKEVEFLLYEE